MSKQWSLSQSLLDKTSYTALFNKNKYFQGAQETFNFTIHINNAIDYRK